MKRLCVCLVCWFVLGIVSFARGSTILLDDFENMLIGGPAGTVDFGAGGGSTIEVSGARDIKYSGSQSLKIKYDAVSDGYMWVARGFGLDSKHTDWLLKPDAIGWQKVKAITFYMYGSDSKTMIAFDIKDNGNEMWRFMIEDNFKGWKQIVCPLPEFFARGDWQPDSADKNAVLDYPIKSFQFEPRPQAKGVLYFDKVELTGQ
ncbi:MAG: carbohydrate binding domain-containing protein [Candidatus Omnitrophica bacterium]|nr:carbohydrate binding domain-containing protein [Candidatus Omnitrophota bacterium]